MNEETESIINSANAWGSLGRECVSLANKAIAGMMTVSARWYIDHANEAFEKELSLRKLLCNNSHARWAVTHPDQDKLGKVRPKFATKEDAESMCNEWNSTYPGHVVIPLNVEG